MHIALYSSQVESTFKLFNSEKEWENVREERKKWDMRGKSEEMEGE